MPSVADPKDIIGHWRGRDKAEIVFYSNGTFNGKNLPSNIFLSYEYGKTLFYGDGTWEIAGKKDPGVIHIIFNNISIQKSKNGFATQILFDKSDSVSTLYIWEGEEGGDRYEFFKIR